MPNILVNNNFYQGTSEACIVDLTPPTFAGITGLDVESRGQIRASWSAATDPTPPIRYEVYIQANTNVGLFNFSNIVAITPNLQYDIFTLPNGSFLQNGTTYYVGIRAIDGVNNRDNNILSQSVISTGVLTSIDTYEVEGSYSNSSADNFELIIWANKNGSLAKNPGAIMGAASYQVYDALGNAVLGMSGSTGSPNSEGLYIFTPVLDTTDRLNNHYEIKVTISVDGENRTNFIPLPSFEKTYKIAAAIDLNSTGQIVGSFWISRNELIVTSGASNGSYTVYDSEGNLIPISESNISPDINGFFTITPVNFPGPLDPTRAFIAKISIEVDGTLYTENIILGNQPEVYDVKAIFSINALNQLEATFWTTKNNERLSGASLGLGSYQVYDKTGAVVAGLNESNIAADGQGLYHTTPVSAALLTDLTHYTVKVTASVANQDRTVFKGFTLLGN